MKTTTATIIRLNSFDLDPVKCPGCLYEASTFVAIDNPNLDTSKIKYLFKKGDIDDLAENNIVCHDCFCNDVITVGDVYEFRKI